MTGVPPRLADLDERRAQARRRALVWFLLGAAVTGLMVAALVALPIIGLAVLASAVQAIGDLDLPIVDWGVLAVATAATLAVVAAVVGAVRHGLRGAPRAVLHGIGARNLTDADRPRFANVVEELSLGLGVERPTLMVIDDPAPNALSVRVGKERTIAATVGLLSLPRNELEAVCAHEMAHLHAADARWVSAAEASLAQVRREALALVLIGFGIVGLSWSSMVWPGVGVGIVVLAIGGATAGSVGRVLPRLRAESDAVADVAAVQLARQPQALGEVCDRLAAHTGRVDRAPGRAAAAWFKQVPKDTTSTQPSESLPPEVRARLLEAMAKPREIANRGPAAELRHRADAAYAEARIARAEPEDPPTAPVRT